MTGKIKLVHSGGNSVSIAVPTSAPSASEVEFKLPQADGSANQALISDGSGNLSFANVAGGKILQVVQTAKTDVVSTTSASFGAISGFSVNITPSATSSKVLVTVDIKLGNSGAGAYIKLLRDSTDIYLGDAASSRTQCLQQTYGGNDTGEGKYGMAKMGGTFLDSPNTTSQITYAVQFLRLGGNSPQTLYVNRVGSETAGEYVGRAASSITAIEVAA